MADHIPSRWIIQDLFHRAHTKQADERATLPLAPPAPEYKVKIYFLQWICATGTVGSDLPILASRCSLCKRCRVQVEGP